jgi:hypothetical protein
LLQPKENHKCGGYFPKYRTTTMAEHRLIQKYNRDDWDDDQYDRTAPAFVPKNPDEEDSGTVRHCQFMTEDEWLMWKFGTTDIPNFGDFED